MYLSMLSSTEILVLINYLLTKQIRQMLMKCEEYANNCHIKFNQSKFSMLGLLDDGPNRLYIH